MKEKFDVTDLCVDKMTLSHGPLSVIVSLKGVSGSDFVACCDEDLLKEIILAAGEEYCLEALNIQLEGE